MKFRVWNDGKYVSGELVVDTAGNAYRVIDEGGGQEFLELLQGAVVEFSTGLRDCKKVEIFAGDKVLSDQLGACLVSVDVVSRLMLTDVVGCSYYVDSEHVENYGYEVIGNIHYNE